VSLACLGRSWLFWLREVPCSLGVSAMQATSSNMSRLPLEGIGVVSLAYR